ncbi:IS5 family transposase [Amycolatopsis sp. NPDC059027]|uniref:IS5 family transposase n=1 Tax=Amycolatopsis sp. NPDC059027 TaxID=3346709 RepID=UPI00366FF4BD
MIKPLLPPQQGGGRRWCEHRQVINAIVWKLRTGARWRDLPERHGPWKTAHERLRLWTKDGTWGKILDHVIVKDDAVGDVEWVTSIDSSVVRAHQHSAGARKRGMQQRHRSPRRRRGRTRAVPWRTEHQDPPRGRRARAADAVSAHSRASRRQSAAGSVAAWPRLRRCRTWSECWGIVQAIPRRRR